MSKPIIMPQVGQDVETAIISEWKIKENDLVTKGDIIAIVDSDKASFEVEAFESGVVQKLLYKEGDEARVFEPIAYLVDENEDQPAIPKNEEVLVANDRPVAGPVQTRIRSSAAKRIFVSPLARKIAREEKIDLSLVAGSGPEGRIIKRDVIAFLKTPESAIKVTPVPVQAEVSSDSTNEIPFSKMRARIAERLVSSKQTIPHFYLFIDVDVSLMTAIHSAYIQKTETKVSINDIVIASVAKALARYPRINSHVKNDRLILQKNINIGVAVSVADGLLVPVIPDADQKNVSEIAAFSRAIIDQVRRGVMKNQAPGTFTISNLGMHAINSFLPIINPPEAAILGVGTIEKRVVPLANNAIGVREMMTLSLVCDHRAVDGVEAAKFLNEVKTNLENFSI
jgi:pyruvate dehydrogenase E2 component (dihydrolipoamide acetyltransferase)